MEKSTICFVLMVFVSEAFFIQSKDIKKILRFFPGLEEEPVHHRRQVHFHPLHYHRRYENPGALPYFDDRNNRHDKNDHYSKENMENNKYNNKNLQEENSNDRTFTHHYRKPIHNDRKNRHHENCNEDHDHSYYDRRPHKFPENRNEKPQKNKKYEESEENDDYYEEKDDYSQNKQKGYHYQRKYKTPKKVSPVQEEAPEYVDRNIENRPSHLNYKKDYVTGVLVTIPKIKNDEDVNHYLHPQNLFLQNFLKGEDHHHAHPHHPPEKELIKSYIY